MPDGVYGEVDFEEDDTNSTIEPEPTRDEVVQVVTGLEEEAVEQPGEGEEIILVEKPGAIREIWDNLDDNIKRLVKAFAIGAAIYGVMEIMNGIKKRKEAKKMKTEEILDKIEAESEGLLPPEDEEDDELEEDEDDFDDTEGNLDLDDDLEDDDKELEEEDEDEND